MIVVVDYGMGNLASIFNMFKKIGVEVKISHDPSDVLKADKLILPGVGAFDHGMTRLQELELIPVLNQRVLVEKCPVLGLCLGMQLMTRSSEEGVMSGLGWFDAETKKFKFEGGLSPLKIPHMGWNVATPGKYTGLFSGFDSGAKFYFVHTYHVVCHRKEDVLATSMYGYEFASAIHRGSIYGTQFHPEKSHKFGMRLLKNFSELCA